MQAFNKFKEPKYVKNYETQALNIAQAKSKEGNKHSTFPCRPRQKHWKEHR